MAKLEDFSPGDRVDFGGDLEPPLVGTVIGTKPDLKVRVDGPIMMVLDGVDPEKVMRIA